jgi:hypothetical protein
VGPPKWKGYDAFSVLRCSVRNFPPGLRGKQCTSIDHGPIFQGRTKVIQRDQVTTPNESLVKTYTGRLLGAFGAGFKNLPLGSYEKALDVIGELPMVNVFDWDIDGAFPLDVGQPNY